MKQIEPKFSGQKEKADLLSLSLRPKNKSEKNKMLPDLICTLWLFLLCMSLVIVIGFNDQLI